MWVIWGLAVLSSLFYKSKIILNLKSVYKNVMIELRHHYFASSSELMASSVVTQRETTS